MRRPERTGVAIDNAAEFNKRFALADLCVPHDPIVPATSGLFPIHPISKTKYHLPSSRSCPNGHDGLKTTR